ncbi:MAG TPA: hypothetical protein VEU55_08195 [Gemmatimonadales bacterium]|nr:hypothetical protein [Gemmatimonadales bacterium]
MTRASTRPAPLARAVALALIAALAAWQPAMLVSMARTPLGGAHAAHATQHAGSSHHHALALQCCSLCSLACAGTPPVPSAPAALVSPAPARAGAALARGHACRRAAWPHRLPFSLGPPTLRVA